MIETVTASSLQDAIHRMLLLHLESGRPQNLPDVLATLAAAGFEPAAVREGIDTLAGQGLLEIHVARSETPFVQLLVSEGADLSAYDLAQKSKMMPVFHSEPSMQTEALIDPTQSP